MGLCAPPLGSLSDAGIPSSAGLEGAHLICSRRDGALARETLVTGPRSVFRQFRPPVQDFESVVELDPSGWCGPN